jgi:hypothetical protein
MAMDLGCFGPILKKVFKWFLLLKTQQQLVKNKNGFLQSGILCKVGQKGPDPFRSGSMEDETLHILSVKTGMQPLG